MTSGSGGMDTSGSGDIVRTLHLLWDLGPRPSRGPKPGLTLDRIVEAAVRVADEEGLEAVSMRRLSTELGAGTMSLYRYVPGKGELLDLMLDRVQRTDGDPSVHGDDWRSALETLGRESLALYQRHPWLLRANQSRPVLGPSAIDGMEKVISRIKPMGLSDPELISVVVMIDSYVIGAARTQLYAKEAERRTGLTDTEFWAAQHPVLEQVMASGRYPVMAALSEDAFGPEFDHFEFGLQRILDGLDALVGRRGRVSAPKGRGEPRDQPPPPRSEEPRPPEADSAGG
ncbi:TetR/AcrR family transcriptional regulator [Streptomyces sp. NPDC002701]|uniref:TetR/AcrR family transcriptional regulator n=1 Tax=Streptomyces sp. NPDC002701 TaxID=3364661 RepID=UPI0036849A74